MPQEHRSIYEAIGDEKLQILVDAFYKRVASHSELTPIFPADLTETKRKQKQFLTQFFGGPPLYIQEHGHPMLRARHMPFPITPTRRDAWLSCMREAVFEVGIEQPYERIILERLTMTANNMMNTPEDEKGESM
ncbi:globin domain-containing protein [Salimicrobium humidisoli]|uniref:Globin n=1 Tax=Salimicrobium humidisoli TaxID=2029857 RepID=A0ABX4HSD2_9BACI|nr:globin [Salimicrobium humidisoli]PBB06132.1 globin [Salimicrobium humidisoli]